MKIGHITLIVCISFLLQLRISWCHYWHGGLSYGITLISIEMILTLWQNEVGNGLKNKWIISERWVILISA